MKGMAKKKDMKTLLTTKEYACCDVKTKHQEALIREFLLEKADTLRLTRQQWSKGLLLLRRVGTDEDLKVRRVKRALEPFFLKKEVNNKRYNNIDQGTHTHQHYFFLLSPFIKEKLRKESLFWNTMFSNNFYGFEDPTFYKDEKMLGSVISHEGYVNLYLTDKERKAFEKEGFMFIH